MNNIKRICHRCERKEGEISFDESHNLTFTHDDETCDQCWNTVEELYSQPMRHMDAAVGAFNHGMTQTGDAMAIRVLFPWLSEEKVLAVVKDIHSKKVYGTHVRR